MNRDIEIALKLNFDKQAVLLIKETENVDLEVYGGLRNNVQTKMPAAVINSFAQNIAPKKTSTLILPNRIDSLIVTSKIFF